MSPFAPKGSRALRVIIAEKVSQAPYGDVLTFTELCKALDVADDDGGRARVRQSVSAARPLLLHDHARALVAVRGKGYRVAQPGEFAGIATDYRRRADRSMSTALANIEHAPVNDMTPEELKRHRAVGIVVRNLVNRMTSAEQRLADLEKAVFGDGPTIIPGKVEDEG